MDPIVEILNTTPWRSGHGPAELERQHTLQRDITTILEYCGLKVWYEGEEPFGCFSHNSWGDIPWMFRNGLYPRVTRGWCDLAVLMTPSFKAPVGFDENNKEVNVPAGYESPWPKSLEDPEDIIRCVTASPNATPLILADCSYDRSGKKHSWTDLDGCLCDKVLLPYESDETAEDQAIEVCKTILNCLFEKANAPIGAGMPRAGSAAALVGALLESVL